MRFERKIFISLFCVSFAMGFVLLWAGHHFLSLKTRDEFVSRYTVLNKVLADTLTRVDASTESLMLNAAKTVVERDSRKGLLSTDELKKMRSELGVTHLFVVDRSGKFIRSTNEDPALIPNLFSFCEDYKNFFSDSKYSADATPIITPMPEPKPHKFLFVPNASKSRIIEVGVRVDSIAKTLMEAIKADPNVRSMSLYSPKGASFGTFSAESVSFEEQSTQLPNDLNSTAEVQDGLRVYTKVESTHTHCCQCDVKGTSSNGSYYYVLESFVSKAELNAVQAKMRTLFVFLALGNLFVAFILAKLVSARLVRNIRKAVSRVRSIKSGDSITERIGIEGVDEVAFLTQEFDKLLDQRAESQQRLIKAEKSASRAHLAKVVAHNIRSPLLAIEMMIPQMFMLPERTRRVLANSVNEIKELSEQLKSKPEALTAQDSTVSQVGDYVFLPVLVEDVVNQKQIEYSNRKDIKISFTNSTASSQGFSKVSSGELRSVISNLVNNAVEAYAISGGSIDVVLSSSDKKSSISVIDKGQGISDEVKGKLGKMQYSSKDGLDRGIGLQHAFEVVSSWGGQMKISSEVGLGTVLTIEIPNQERTGILQKIKESVVW